MTQPFLGQIQPMAFNFAPKNWVQCNGQILPIQQYTALFSLLGTYYGGNGVTTFGLPDLRSRAPLDDGTWAGENYVIGEMAGAEAVTITNATMPNHNHLFVGQSVAATTANPAVGGVLANVAGSGTPPAMYSTSAPPAPLVPLNAGSIGPNGGNLGHSNLQPYLTLNWCIAMSGLYPSRN